ncbi:TIGR03009 domain-containing protein [Fimbriiglobus ruber]|uniref:Uncharacterized protein n=1 Tax=Fimbriiglobus ruber TaxID=1908690 RepID=A0A225E3A3_9BACT|nr:TIGR03009 domain-containing protein [Fimbriiglobus ruber]OWK45278.1 hypothetical protein FRUB_01609 [Fimbriiglobus ruber]
MLCSSFAVAVTLATVAGPQSSLPAHLAAWERAMAATTNFYCPKLTLARRNTVAKTTTISTGSFLAMKPDRVRFRLIPQAKKTTKADPNNYFAYIITGDALWEYTGETKKIVEFRFVPGENADGAAPWTDPERWLTSALARVYSGLTTHPVFAVAAGQFEPGQLTERFHVRVVKEDKHYVYLELRPRNPAEQDRYKKLVVALMLPGEGHKPYVPAQVRVVTADGQEIEDWRFENGVVNATGVAAAQFQYVKPPDGWTVVKLPPGAPAKDAPAK